MTWHFGGVSPFWQVFQEGGSYTPPIQSQVLHNYLVVSPIEHHGTLYYKVVCARRASVDKVRAPPVVCAVHAHVVAQFGPPLVLPSVYERDASLRNFLITKCINANLAALRSPGLAIKVAYPAKLKFLEDMQKHTKTGKSRE